MIFFNIDPNLKHFFLGGGGGKRDGAEGGGYSK